MASWKTAGGDHQLRMQGAVSKLIDSNRPGPCPVCGNPLRFYYHEWRTAPRRTGTVWVWCPACGTWDHASRIELPARYAYDDPFAALTLADFDRLERTGLLDRVDALWGEGRLPHAFRVTDTKKTRG
ncbi:MAG TPA: hypothetical protein VFX28_06365 [Methylomirabilota bacterium]|nr:hypothetical protein [Methylomirabilota bacterium]